MTDRTAPPFRADHVGSLLRPRRLLEARRDAANGELAAEELRRLEDEAIREVVGHQEAVGLPSATDGEFRRASWHMDFLYRIGGVETAQNHITVRFKNEQGEFEFTSAGVRIDERLHLAEPIFADHFDFLAAQVTTATPKLTIPSPSMLHYRGGPAAINPDVYPDMDQFWSDLTRVYAEEIAALYQRGCRYLQLDDVSLAYLNDPEQRRMIAERGDDAEYQHLRYIRTINEALKDKPADMTVTTHMCRGNYKSSWVAEGSYDFVADDLFNGLEVDGFFMEWDDEQRTGGFEPLRYLPDDKLVVLGLVTTKTGELEDKDRLKRRIEEAGTYTSLDQLCLSPQCGFSSTLEGNDLTHEQQWAKLGRIIEVAEEMWGGQ